MVIFCPDHALTRNRLFEDAGTRRYLHQFSLAKEQIDRAERGAAEEEDAGEEDADEEDREPEGVANQEFELGPEITRAG